MFKTKAKWYVLYRHVKRKREYTIVYANFPLQGRWSWSLLSGIPHESCDDARREIE